jgi:glycosyltransferase involved in cell wall biosynthesis
LKLAFLIVGLLLAYAWTRRLLDAHRGMPRVPDIADSAWDTAPADTPRVSVIVPARNEAERVESSLRSLLALDYSNYEVIAIDDRSTDATGEIIGRIASNHSGAPLLRVLHVSELPSGWLGKPHAMWLAAQQATGEWLLFTDADVRFRPDALRRAIAYAEQSRADHLVLFPTYDLRSLGEEMMMAGFALLFVFGHRPWAVADPNTKDFMGLGPFNLIRREAYEKIGTFGALRMEVIEDMKLGKLVKDHRLAQRNVFGTGLLTWRWFDGALGLTRVLRKNIFALMQYRWAKAAGASVLFACLNLLPFIGAALAPGWTRLPYALALAAIAALYGGLGRRMKLSPFYFVLHPISTVLLMYTMLASMAHVARHRGVVWRGTRYSLEELRSGMV